MCYCYFLKKLNDLYSTLDLLNIFHRNETVEWKCAISIVNFVLQLLGNQTFVILNVKNMFSVCLATESRGNELLLWKLR